MSKEEILESDQSHLSGTKTENIECGKSEVESSSQDTYSDASDSTKSPAAIESLRVMNVSERSSADIDISECNAPSEVILQKNDQWSPSRCLRIATATGVIDFCLDNLPSTTEIDASQAPSEPNLWYDVNENRFTSNFDFSNAMRYKASESCQVDAELTTENMSDFTKSSQNSEIEASGGVPLSFGVENLSFSDSASDFATSEHSEVATSTQSNPWFDNFNEKLNKILDISAKRRKRSQTGMSGSFSSHSLLAQESNLDSFSNEPWEPPRYINFGASASETEESEPWDPKSLESSLWYTSFEETFAKVLDLTSKRRKQRQDLPRPEIHRNSKKQSLSIPKSQSDDADVKENSPINDNGYMSFLSDFDRQAPACTPVTWTTFSGSPTSYQSAANSAVMETSAEYNYSLPAIVESRINTLGEDHSIDVSEAVGVSHNNDCINTSSESVKWNAAASFEKQCEATLLRIVVLHKMLADRGVNITLDNSPNAGEYRGLIMETINELLNDFVLVEYNDQWLTSLADPNCTTPLEFVLLDNDKE